MKLVRRHIWMALLATILGLAAFAGPAAAANHWVAGDIHTHTYLTDGKNTQGEVLNQAFNTYGLSYFANSEHGGFSTYDPSGAKFVTPIPRWLTLLGYSYPLVAYNRTVYPTKQIIQGLEWNAPGHEHVSVGIIGADQPSGISKFEYLFDGADTDFSRSGEGTAAVTHTEYAADGTPTVVTDVPATSLVKQDGYQTDPANAAKLLLDGSGKPVAKDTAGKYADTLAAVSWLEDNYGDESYAVINHPSRALAWTAKDFRQMNDAAPDVVVGMEGFPGHQAETARGGYSYTFDANGAQVAQFLADGSVNPAFSQTVTDKARTYGGADLMTAKVGGLWDSLLAEGRHFWVFNDSDYHTYNSAIKSGPSGPDQVTVGEDWHDYYPGQYNKTWTSVAGSSYSSLVAGMKSGNSFIVNGDLVKALDFRAANRTSSKTMGGTLAARKGQAVTITIRFKSPKMNFNGDHYSVNHVDLIAGQLTGLIAPTLADGSPNPAYANDDVTATTKLVKRFTKANMRVINGWTTMTFVWSNPQKSMYFRLRGTNLGINTPKETSNGNPVIDTASYVPGIHDPAFPNDPTKVLAAANSVDLPWTDLWFYSNPIFVSVK